MGAIAVSLQPASKIAGGFAPSFGHEPNKRYERRKWGLKAIVEITYKWRYGGRCR
jgi:hypothetical protein